jgi:CheY-like chemotaxis protein
LHKRILVVEDNIINQKVAKGILQKFGCECEIVVNGEEALKILAAEIFDLVLMDCQMPVMDGYEATRQIRNPRTPVLKHTIPIVAMTANALVGDREKVLDAGMNDFVTKPVSMQKMREALERWIPE